MTNHSIRSFSLVALAGAVAACSGSPATTPIDNSSGAGAAATGGTVTNGGTSAIGGSLSTGGSFSNGGAGLGGNVSTGGLTGTNVAATGGRTGAGGANPTGGSVATGGSTRITTGTGTGGSGAGGAATGGAAVGGNGGQKNTGGTTTAVGGGTNPAGTGGANPTGGTTASGTGGGTAWQPSATCVQKASTLANQMTLAQRIGQMTQVDSGNLTTSLASQAFLGGVLTGGGTHPGGSTNPDNSVTGFANLIASYLNVGKTFSPHAGMLYGLDAVHGNGKVVNAVIFPHAIGLGATRNPTLVQSVGRITAQEMLGVGANWAFTPTLAATRDVRWGRTYETFSSEPDLSSQMGAAVIQGLQNSKLGSSQSVLACAKHFAGDGATNGGTNTGNCTLNETDFRKLAVEPYRASINAGVGSIMASYSSYQGAKMTESKHWITDVLKGELGFQGMVESDWDAVGRLPDSGWNAQVTAAVNAGIDMIMLSGATSTTDTTVHTAADLATALTSVVNSGAVAGSRVIDAVTRILTIKCEMGLLDGDTSVDSTLQSQVGSSAHRDVARDAVRQSLVLLKNDGVLPLSKTAAKIHVTGSGADSLAKQCGGWTIGWQGLNDKGASSTTGTTVLAAVKKKVSGSTVTTSTDGSGASGATFAIVVVGEAPYAETQGDSTNPTLTSADFAAISAVKSAGVPFVVVLFSGRPLILTSGGTSALDQSNAFIAAWLPGTEGDGIADVLFGDNKPTGKLSFEWPSSLSQLPLNVGDGQTPLFAYGYGLTYP
jgi:beta-glucosidase